MKPIIRFNAIVISLTTFTVFNIWLKFSILILNYPEWFKDPENTKHNILGVLLVALMSIGVYRLLFLLLSFFVNQFQIIKRWVFSSDYIEGTWVGFYIGVSGKVRYLIENFEQNFDGVVIKGTAFDENKNIHSFWTSESVNLDTIKGELTYQYKVRTPNEQTDPIGLAYFSYNRSNSRKPVWFLNGFSSDTHLLMKCKAMEYKWKNETKYDLNEALQKAEEFYQTKKDIVYNK